MGVQLTPGQKCILELLQRKLLNTIQAYRILSFKRQELYRQSFEPRPSCVVGKLGDNNISPDASNEVAHIVDHITRCNKDDSPPAQDYDLRKQVFFLDVDICGILAKIERISARQKRFTNEILSGNGMNTIPKESYFRAMGLITKDALNKINSKSGERRRRTTANPRFSHEAIQAKRALEHNLNQQSTPPSRSSNRLEDRTARGVNTRASAAEKLNGTNGRRGRDKADNDNNNNNTRLPAPKNNNTNNNNANNLKQQSSNKSSNGGRSSGRNSNKDASSNLIKSKNNNIGQDKTNSSTGTSTSISTNRTNQQLPKKNLAKIEFATSCLSAQEKEQLQEQFGLIQQQIYNRISRISDEREKNRQVEEENELIRKRGLDMMNALNEFCQNRVKQANNANSSAANAQSIEMPLNLVKTSGGRLANVTSGNLNSSVKVNGRPENTESSELWLNLKCDESLEGVET